MKHLESGQDVSHSPLQSVMDFPFPPPSRMLWIYIQAFLKKLSQLYTSYPRYIQDFLHIQDFLVIQAILEINPNLDKHAFLDI